MVAALKQVVVLVAVASYAGVPVSAQEGKPGSIFPSVKGTTLAGKTVSVPDDVVSRYSVLIVTFNFDYRKASSEWYQKIAKDPRLNQKLDVYQLLDIGDVPRFVQPMITWGMRRRVPSAQRSGFIVAFHGDDDLRGLLGHDSNIYTVLSTRDGKVAWIEKGSFTSEKSNHIAEYIAPEGADSHSAKAANWQRLGEAISLVMETAE